MDDTTAWLSDHSRDTISIAVSADRWATLIDSLTHEGVEGGGSLACKHGLLLSRTVAATRRVEAAAHAHAVAVRSQDVSPTTDAEVEVAIRRLTAELDELMRVRPHVYRPTPSTDD